MSLDSYNWRKHGDPTCFHILEKLVAFGLEEIGHLLEFCKFFKLKTKTPSFMHQVLIEIEVGDTINSKCGNLGFVTTLVFEQIIQA
jgi:hypothetical protein